MLSRKYIYIVFWAAMSSVLTAFLISLLAVYRDVIFENNVQAMKGISYALLMFFIYELFVIVFTETKYTTLTPRQSINLFLGFKVGKIILSLFFIVIYAVVVRVEFMRFLFVFVVLYMIYLLFDTIYLISREKSMKKKQYKLKEIEKLSNYYKQ